MINHLKNNDLDGGRIISVISEIITEKNAIISVITKIKHSK